jgi:hypothetical protein
MMVINVKLTRANKLRKLLFRHRRRASADDAIPNVVVEDTAAECESWRSYDTDQDVATVPVSSKKRARRTVHFQDSPPEIIYNEAPAITEEEKTASFWSLEELTQIRTDIKQDVHLLETGYSLGTLTPRGLEKWMNPLGFRNQRDKVIAAVLNEQKIQAGEGAIDEELIAQAAMDESYAHRQAALARADKDRAYVLNMTEEVLGEDKIFCERPQRIRNRCRSHPTLLQL